MKVSGMDFTGSGKGPVYFPLVFRLALKLEQIPWTEFVEDSALATYTLRNTQRLFRADAVINWFDDWVEAESAGIVVNRDEFGRVNNVEHFEQNRDPGAVMAAAPMQVMIQLAQRLSRELDDMCAVVGYLTGPMTLAARMRGASSILTPGYVPSSDASVGRVAVPAMSTEVARALCEAGCKALLVVEHEVTTEPWINECAAIINIAQYYGRDVGLLCRQPVTAELVDAAIRTGFSAVVAPNTARNATVISTDILGRDKCPSISAEASLVITDWEVPLETSPQDLIRLREEMV